MELLYIILFQYIRENNSDETNIIIAKNVIRNLKKIKDLSLEATADLCSCSPSTLNRFFKVLGLHSFKSVKKILCMPQFVYNYTDYDPSKYLDNIYKNLEQTNNFINSNRNLIKDIVYTIHSSRRIVLFGFSDNQLYSLEFQCRMMMMDKYVEICNDLNDDLYNDLTNDDFAIVISYQGNYFINKELMRLLNEKKVKSLLISQLSNTELNKKFDYNVQIGNYSYYKESVYSLIYILNIICFEYNQFINSF